MSGDGIVASAAVVVIGCASALLSTVQGLSWQARAMLLLVSAFAVCAVVAIVREERR